MTTTTATATLDTAMKQRLMLFLLLALALVLSACAVAPEPTEPEPPGSIAEIASGDGRFDTLVAALEAADLVDTFADAQAGPFTVFAPTDEAFAELLDALGISAADLLANPNLGAILSHHVVAGAVTSEQVAMLDSATTLLGQDIAIEASEGDVVLDGNVQVTETDIEAANGVIHVIDGVLLPDTLAELAAANDDFSTLVAALQAADLGGALDDLGSSLTVFAPTNAAFETLAEALEVEVADLLELEALGDILLYHVVEGRVLADEVVTLESATTLEGSAISIAVVDGGVVLNGYANVIATDVQALNGVIHVIDEVLLPPAE